MGVMTIVTAEEGDKRVPWDPTNPAQVEEARSKFNEFIGAGHRAYRMGSHGQRGERISEFDPNAGEILFTGRYGLAGG